MTPIPPSLYGSSSSANHTGGSSGSNSHTNYRSGNGSMSGRGSGGFHASRMRKAPTTTMASVPSGGSAAEGKTQVWVQSSAIDALRNPKTHRLATRLHSGGAGVNSSVGSAGAGAHYASSETGSDIGAASSASFRSSVSSTTSSSSFGVAGDFQQGHARTQQWGWLRGWMLSSSSKGVEIKLQEDSSLSSSGSTFLLPSNALDGGTVVLANENIVNTDGTANIPSDLITLTHLHEPAVVFSLQQRYAQNHIYTATGPVLLALNPFQTIRGLYGEAQMRKYADSTSYYETKSSSTTKASKLPPHVYQIADASYRSMMRELEDHRLPSPNQSILVSGESGAGKTVTTKFVMKYLAALSQRATKSRATTPKRAYLQVQEQQQQKKNLYANITNSSNNSDKDFGSSSFSSNSIEGQVLQSNPILESFGNARTVRNDNSSRFGKFMEIQFQQEGKLLGASIETYLLEKVRLVTQSPGERNYHIFYQLLAALPANELRPLYLASTATPADFRITCNSNTYDRRDGVTDSETFRELRTAMRAMKFSKPEEREIFSLTVALLHLSNLDFWEADGSEVGIGSHHGDAAAQLDGDNVHLEPVCQLLGVTALDLNQALCTFAIQAGRDGSVRRSLSKAKAEKGLEALIKATYGSLFTYLVRRVNDSIAYPKYQDEADDADSEGGASYAEPPKPAATIGVLDIFGFESFTTNSFEQLCINYCNEALQQQFNAFVLKNEQEEYEREGIEWSFIEFIENKDVLELIDKRGSGILNILDDQCRAPGTTDRSFASDVYAKCQGHPRFQANRSQVASQLFQVQHYAGPVEYTTTNFVEKNRDELPKESMELLLSSTNPFVMHMAEILMDGDGRPPTQGQDHSSDAASVISSHVGFQSAYSLKRSDSSIRKTVGGQFRRQLKDLRRKIDETSPHYIRCLKPNDHLVPNRFDPVIVAEQLRCGGILEAVRVSRAGFTQHYPHVDFLRRYRGLALSGGSTSSGVGGATSLTGGTIQGIGGTSWNGSGSSGRSSWGTKGSNSSNITSRPKPKSKWEVGPNGSYRTGSSSSSFSDSGGRSSFQSNQQKSEVVDAKEECKTILKILVRKMQRLEQEEEKEAAEESMNTKDSGGGSSSRYSSPSLPQTPVASAKAKTYTSKAATPPPAWSLKRTSAGKGTPPSNALPIEQREPPKTAPVKSRYQPWNAAAAKRSEENVGSGNASNRATPSYRRNTSTGPVDLAKAGIQVGKTKVFLRHKAFELLERLRSKQFGFMATKLNAIFRMYLCRIAYVPVRDAYRAGVQGMSSKTSSNSAAVDLGQDRLQPSSYRSKPGAVNPKTFQRAFSASTFSLIEHFQSQLRASIHSAKVTNRNEWGKQGPAKETISFKWVLQDGLWVKNPVFKGDHHDDDV